VPRPRERSPKRRPRSRLRLAFRQPLCPDNLFGHLAATAVPGVEEVRGTTYRRTLRLAHGPGIVELTPTPDYINCRAVLSDMRDLTTTIARSRWLLDLDADPVAIDRQLSLDPSLAPLVMTSHRGAGCRGASTVPRWPFARCSDNRSRPPPPRPTHDASSSVTARPVSDASGGLTHLFHYADSLATSTSRCPRSDVETFAALVTALRRGDLALGPGSDRDESMAALSRSRASAHGRDR
jgi:AraC family transcriptional regulator of adaptative response / DNA-3-methyladenine glycosylase II